MCSHANSFSWHWRNLPSHSQVVDAVRLFHRSSVEDSLDEISSILHDVTHVDLTMVSYGLSLRDTAVAVIPIVAATLLGNLAIGLMICIGAITVAPFARPAVDERTAGWMTIAGVIMAISAFVGSTTGSIDWLAILLTTIWALGAGLMVAIGPQVTQVGLTGVVMFWSCRTKNTRR